MNSSKLCKCALELEDKSIYVVYLTREFAVGGKILVDRKTKKRMIVLGVIPNEEGKDD